MNFGLTRFLFPITFFMLGSSCSFSAPDEPPAPLKAVVGTPFHVTLDSNASTGYKWKLAKPLDENLLKLVETKYEQAGKPLPGAPGKETWTFKAIKPGKTEISLEYVRPWETGVAPAKSTNVVVVISATDSK